MSIDRDVLKAFGWSQDLIEAAEQVADTVGEPLPLPADDVIQVAGSTITSHEIRIGDTSQIVSPELRIH